MASVGKGGSAMHRRRANPLMETTVRAWAETVKGSVRKCRAVTSVVTRWSRWVVPSYLELPGCGKPLGSLRTGWIVKQHWSAFRNSELLTVAPTTLATYTHRAKRYLRWCMQEGYLQAHPDQLVEAPPRVELEAADALTPDELRAVIIAAQEYRSPLLPPGAAELFVRLGCDCGMRPAESWWLSWDELSADQRGCRLAYTAWRDLKNVGARRPVPFPARVAELIEAQPHRGPCIIAGANRYTAAAATYLPWDNLIQRLRQLSGVERLDAVILRHSFATRYMELHGYSDEARRRLMSYIGHQRWSTTEAYYVAPTVQTAVALPIDVLAFEEGA